jgi:tRNA threonylcarbamoyladenosine modification (KEOPS) complex  Pcc1 subunit
MIEIITEPDARHLLLEVLKPELTQRISSRSAVRLEGFDHGVRIVVRGTDLSSFRASVNSIMRLLNVVFGVLKIVGNTREVK